MMDPIGLALENFDPTGAWRIKDNGVAVDTRGVMYDGAPIDGPASLRKALLSHSDMVLRNFTQFLMTYALGRRVEYFDHVDGARDLRRRGAARQPFLVLHPGHREEPGVPDGEGGRNVDTKGNR